MRPTRRILMVMVVAAATVAWASVAVAGPTSGTVRGHSPSIPDQDGIGADHGIVNNDKTSPGTDGNNGCGNDADREDDDNGWCGHKPARETPAPTVSPTPTASEGTEVLGRSLTRP